MTKAEKAKLIDRIFEHYGIQAQTIQLGEEMGELYTAISHRIRNRETTNDKIAEEIADVTFMLRQMAQFFDINEDRIESIIEFKERRMQDRLNSDIEAYANEMLCSHKRGRMETSDFLASHGWNKHMILDFFDEEEEYEEVKIMEATE